eukprot:m.1648155 g.1648155  ORF g.1648155 m.1648155 type:complete len:57 (-) comp78048_c0_seq1:183-353(-)
MPFASMYAFMSKDIRLPTVYGEKVHREFRTVHESLSIILLYTSENVTKVEVEIFDE